MLDKLKGIKQMENYNSFFLQQLAPLLFFQIEEQSEVVSKLVKGFDKFNIKDCIWDNSIIKNRLLNVKYRIKVIETKEYGLVDGIEKDKQSNGHSILSPFNEKSDLFPNGILSEKWFKKYIEDVPFACIFTFKLSEAPEDDSKLVERINNLKSAYQEFRINIVVIIISDSEDASADDERVSNLRHLTGLAKITGLTYLNSHPETVDRDSDILVTSVLTTLKTTATDFYLNIENKVKQRNKKYYSCPSTNSIDTKIELTPIFLETRNLIKQGMICQFSHPYNLESCLKYLEYAYQNLIELSRDNFAKLLKEDSVLPHDERLFTQFRTLIDIIAIHIVRGYLSLEEPISALKKHKAHIINVLDAFSVTEGDCNNWISIQYCWLGELMNLIPKSVLSSLNIKAYKKKSKSSKIFQMVGGVQFNETHDYDLITSPEFVFLKAAELLNKTSSIENNLHYLNNPDNLEKLSREKLQLYSRAKDSLLIEDSSISSSSHENLHSMKQYISWLIAKEYSKLTDEDSLSKTIDFYELCLTESQFGNNNITQYVLQALLKCYSRNKDVNKLLSTMLKISSLCPIENNPLYKIDIKDLGLDTSNICIDNLDNDELQLVDVDTLFLNENYSQIGPNESGLYESCICQLVFKPLLRLDNFKALLSKSNDDTLVELSIKRAEIKFVKQGEKEASNAFKNVILEQYEKALSSMDILQIIDIKENGEILKGNLNATFMDSTNDIDKFKVIQFSQIAQKVGNFLVGQIDLTIEIAISSKGNVLKLNKKQNIVFDDGNSASLGHHTYVYSPASDIGSKAQKKAVRLYSQAPHAIRVLPLKPDVTVTMESSLASSIIVGERISIPFLIQYKSPKNQKVDYKKIQLAPKVKIISDSQDQGFISPLTTRVNWDTLKDDEPLSLKSLVSNEIESRTHILNISILNASLNANDISLLNKTYRASIDLKTLVNEEGETSNLEDGEDEISIYDTADYTLPVISSPFECKFSIGPRYRNGGKVDMPCPFVLWPEANTTHGSNEKVNNYSMPISTRLWLGKLSLMDNLKNQDGQLEIVDTSFNIKSSNPELLVQLEGATETTNKGTVTQLFTTKSKNGFSHRNVMVNSTAIIKWKRKGTDNINEYRSTEWQIALPLSDPRVLLALEFELPNLAKFKYIIENPTPRIFMFTTQLSTDEINDDIEWQFNDDRNIVPLRQPAFPVLPFNRNIIEFYAKLTNNSKQHLIALPQFKVFDVHYKVALPTLAVCDNVVVKNGNALYWQASAHPETNH